MEILKSKQIFSGKRLVFKIVAFRDKVGNERQFEYVERKNQQQVVTMICRSTTTGKILLIKQHRIPIAAIEVAFPAGLVEDGELIEEAALRELREETGYDASITSISCPLPKSAGLTSELSSLVVCEIDESRRGDSNMEDTEEITSIWVGTEEFFDLVKEWNSLNIRISHEVYAYFLGAYASKTR